MRRLKSTLPLGLLGLLIGWALVLSPDARAQSVIPQTQASIPITVSTATTTQLVAAITGKSIYVTSATIVAAGTGNIQFVYGTGTNCATNQGNVTGNFQLTAQTGFATGDGTGIVWVVPQGNALCITTSAAVAMPGVLAYAQF